MHARPSVLIFGLLAAGLLVGLPPGYGGEKKAEGVGPAGKSLKLSERLTAADPEDKGREGRHAKVHAFPMQAGKVYKITMVSLEGDPQTLDPYLRLLDPDGNEVLHDDDGAGFPNALLLFQPDRDGTYKIVCTTYPANQTGKYTLTARETKTSPEELLRYQAGHIADVPPAQQKRTLEAVTKHLQAKKADLSKDDAMMALATAQALDLGGHSKLAALAYERFGKVLAGASDEKLAAAAKSFEGAVRRCQLPGHPIEVKGKTLDGKDLDWKSYRGKVVLVDFWATWCGPCVAELPNVQKLYAAYHGRGFDVVGVSLDRDNGKPEQFIKARKLPWVCIGPDSGGQDLAKYYGVMAIPLPILVDREGRVVSMNARGPDLERLLEKYIGPADGKGGPAREKKSD
jgi:thiol-disulfide isomerase/thioredoxin